MSQPKHPVSLRATSNRLAAILCHIPRYSGHRIAPLMEDTGLSRWIVSHVLRGTSSPTYATAVRITEAVSKAYGRPIPVEEIFDLDGSGYPSHFPCQVFNCRCLPPWAWDRADCRVPAFENAIPGRWTFNVPDNSKQSNPTHHA